MLQNIYMAFTGHLEEDTFTWVRVTAPEKSAQQKFIGILGYFYFLKVQNKPKIFFFQSPVISCNPAPNKIMSNTLKTEAEERVDL